MDTLGAVYYRLDKAEDFLHKKILQPLAFVSLTASALSCLFQILYRFILSKLFSFTFPYTDEFTRYSIIVGVWLIVPIVMKQGLHPSIDLLRDALKGKGKLILYFLIKAITLFCLAIFLYYLVGVIQANVNYRSPMLKIRGSVLYLIPTFGTVMYVFQVIVDLVGVISGKLKPFEFQAAEEELELEEDDEV